MADESCAFPGGSGEASRASGRWLDRSTAEQLLNGAPLEALGLDQAGTDADTAAEAARLMRLLHALRELAGDAGAAEVGRAGAGSAAAGVRPGLTAPGPMPAELPGETAALTAFRQARDTAWTPDAERHGAGASAHGEEYAHRPGRRRVRARGPGDRLDPGVVAYADIGAVRVGGRGAQSGRAAAGARAETGRQPFRFGLVATLAACMLGGVTVAAATTGILPSPFGGSRPSPSVSVSGAVTPADPRVSTTPGASAGGTGTPGPATSPSGPSGVPSESGPPDSGTPQNGTGGSGGTGVSENWWATMINACRDYRGGDDMDDRTQRELEDAARGKGRVESFCDGLLGSRDADPGAVHDSPDTSTNGGGTGYDEAGQVGDSAGDGNENNAATPSPVTTTPTPTTDISTPEPSEASEVTPTVTFSEPPTQ